MASRNPMTFNIPVPSGFLLIVDPKNVDNSEKWKSFSTAERGHRIDLDGPEAERLTANERQNMQWEKLPDGVLRIFGKTNQETGIIAEGKKRLIANQGLAVRLDAGPIDQSVAVIEDACRADRAGFVPQLGACAIKLGDVPGRHKDAGMRTATVVFDDEGRPLELRIALR